MVLAYVYRIDQSIHRKGRKYRVCQVKHVPDQMEHREYTDLAKDAQLGQAKSSSHFHIRRRIVRSRSEHTEGANCASAEEDSELSQINQSDPK